jgi:4-alpha-glucanotransferase
MPFARSSGILLHISSLPSYGGIGDLGPAAYRFADFLAAAKQRYWQVLPLNPVGYGNSPYGATSAFAGNPLLISLEYLSDWGWIAGDRLSGLPGSTATVDFDAVGKSKLPLLAEAAQNFIAKHESPQLQHQWQRFEDFCSRSAYWLEDYVMYAVVRRKFGFTSWHTWPPAIVQREAAAMHAIMEEHAQELAVERVIQFAFEEQWQALRAYCTQRKIDFIGDIAIFVSYDSADVWNHPEIFELEKEDLLPKLVAGVPPDYFSAGGQKWGNPLYKWDVLAARGFDWWVDRVRRAQELYGAIRLDHFRGFEAYWAIPAEDENAINGTWVKAPGDELFTVLQSRLGDLPFIAEDLGVITKEVNAVRKKFHLPGMRILQFGFGNRGAHAYLPHSYEPNTVVYTGTHDNDTTLGWWQSGANKVEREAVTNYIGDTSDIVWSMIQLAATSVADICLFPLQDLLGLGSEARMNTPAAAENNWGWRCAENALSVALAKKMAALIEVTDRDGVLPTDLA